jgi:streptomycin 6-kinase
LHRSADLDSSFALLLERCRPGTPLSAIPERDQDVVISDLLRQLRSAPTAGHNVRPLAEMCAQWAEESEAKLAALSDTIDPGLARDGIAAFRALPATADRHVLLCTDLHAKNVLAAQRERWLVIDTKPYLGDPTYDPLQHMLNCSERLRTDPHGFVSRMAHLLDLDPTRLLLWLFARCVHEAPDWPALADVARQIAPT